MNRNRILFPHRISFPDAKVPTTEKEHLVLFEQIRDAIFDGLGLVRTAPDFQDAMARTSRLLAVVMDRLDPVQTDLKGIAGLAVYIHVVCIMHATVNRLRMFAKTWESTSEGCPFYELGLLGRTGLVGSDDEGSVESAVSSEEDNQSNKKKFKKAKKKVIDDDDGEEEETKDCRFADKVEESEEEDDELMKPKRSSRETVDLVRSEHASRRKEVKSKHSALEARMLSHVDNSDDDEDNRPTKKKKKNSRSLADADMEEDLDAASFDALMNKKKTPTRTPSNRLTVEGVLRERNIFAVDLLRHAEIATFIVYARNTKQDPTTVLYNDYDFNTYEYIETNEETKETHAFIVRCVLHSLELMAKEKIKLGWRTLFNEPASDQPVTRAVSQPATQPVAQTQYHPVQQPVQQYNGNNKQSGSFASGFNSHSSGSAYAGNSSGNLQNQNGNANNGSGWQQPSYKAFGSDRAQPNVISASPDDRIYWAKILEEMGILNIIGQRTMERMQGASAEQIDKVVGEEFKEVRLKCGEQMPKRGTAGRLKDGKNYNIYTEEDREDMLATAHKVLGARGLVF